MCDFINIITPLTVNDLFDYVNNILLLLFYCFSKLRETISYRSVENIMPRILYGSLDQGNGKCQQVFLNYPILEPIHMAMHLSIFNIDRTIFLQFYIKSETELLV